MPVTQLDSKCALIVIDLQKGTMGFPFVQPIADVIVQTRKLLDAFRDAKQTVVLVNAAGSPQGRNEMPHSDIEFPDDWTDLIPELDAQPDDVRITKYCWGAFMGTDLESKLKSTGVTNIVLAGVATSIGVESTAREAHSLGFNVTLAVDAMTDLSDEAHASSVSRIFPQLGEAGSSQDIVDKLAARSAQP